MKSVEYLGPQPPSLSAPFFSTYPSPSPQPDYIGGWIRFSAVNGFVRLLRAMILKNGWPDYTSALQHRDETQSASSRGTSGT